MVLKELGLCNRCPFSPYQISSDPLKKIEIPVKAMETIKTYVQNVWKQSLMFYRDELRGNIADKHQAHLAAQLIKDTSDFIMNTSSDQLSAIKNNLLKLHPLCQH